MDRRPVLFTVMRTLLLTALLVPGLVYAAVAEAPRPVTFSRDVAPLLYANCATCHREGEAAPFPLLGYADARKHAKQIADVVSRRIMPPWKADPGVAFLGERRLSESQISLLREWASQGCPEGDPSQAPAPPRFPATWHLGTPDVVVKMAEPYTVPAAGRDIYRCFVIHVEIPAGKYLRATEFRPGNPRVVHHAVLTTLSRLAIGMKLAVEPKDAGPGFSSGLAAPGQRLPGPTGIWAPGKEPLALPEGYAMKWPAGQVLVLQLHLHPSGKQEIEQSSVGLYLTDVPPRGALYPLTVMNKNVNIPPGEAHYTLASTTTLPVAAEVIGAFPHMHLLGRTVKSVATLPDGSTAPLISISDWDFNWQSYYQYAAPLKLPAGTRIDTTWTFDNSAVNPTQPSTPPRRVRFGEQTTDEMGVLILDVIPDGPLPARLHRR